MPAPFTAGMPPDTELDNGCSVVFEAIDPASGAPVSGVAFTDGLIYVDVIQGQVEEISGGRFRFVPGPGS